MRVLDLDSEKRNRFRWSKILEQVERNTTHTTKMSTSTSTKTPKAFVIRREGFSSAHRMYNTKWDEETNKRIFGQCYQLHGHNYQLEVSLYGPIDPDTGMVFDIGILKKIIKEHVLDLLDHKRVDDHPYFTEKPSTAENISVFIWHQLLPNIPAGLLYEIKLYETEKNVVVYRGE